MGKVCFPGKFNFYLVIARNNNFTKRCIMHKFCNLVTAFNCNMYFLIEILLCMTDISIWRKTSQYWKFFSCFMVFRLFWIKTGDILIFFYIKYKDFKEWKYFIKHKTFPRDKIQLNISNISNRWPEKSCEFLVLYAII